MTTQSTLGIIVYAPALLATDGRTLAVVHGMERTFPGLRLDWKVSDDGRPIALPHRDAEVDPVFRTTSFFALAADLDVGGRHDEAAE
jgi:hypothetical protein